MSKIKKSSEKGKAIDLDVDAFQVQVEKEIDSLLVPFQSDPEPAPPLASASVKPVSIVEDEVKESPKPAPQFTDMRGEDKTSIVFPPVEDSLSLPESSPDVSTEMKEVLPSEIDDELQILFPSSPEEPESAADMKAAVTDLPTLMISLDEPAGIEFAAEEQAIPEPVVPSAASPLNGLQIDMSAFDAHIDKEIDKLFVPAGEAAASGSSLESPELPPQEQLEKGTLAVEPSQLDDLEPEMPSFASPAKNKLGINMEEFEAQVEREIDSLFVPLREATEAGAGVAQQGPPPLQPAPVSEARAAVPQEQPSKAPEAQIPASGAAMETELPAGSDRDALSSILDEFNVAYLSLDWEFSSENIARLDNASQKLEPYCQEHGGYHSLFRIFRALLQRIKVRPDHITPGVIVLMRDTHEMLKRVLPLGSGPDPRDKVRIRDLILQFQSLREGGTPVPVKTDEPVAVQPQEEPVSPLLDSKMYAASAGAVSSAVEWESEPWPESFDEIRRWLDESQGSAREALAGFEHECGRLLQIEELLSKKPALTPLKTRIGKIRSTMEGHLAFLQKLEDEWARQIRALGRFADDEEKLAGLAVFELPSQGGVVSGGASVLPAAAEAPEPSAPARAPEIRQEQVFFFRISGRSYAVLASQVVKIDQAPEKKTQKILARGFATLGDFKPLFRSLKTGLFGSWRGLPSEILKGYRFSLLPEEVFKTSVFSGERGVILVSTGRQHGVIFAESSGIELQNEVEILLSPTPNENIVGTIRTETGQSAEVLNLDRILKRGV